MFGEFVANYLDLRSYHDLAIHAAGIFHIKSLMLGFSRIEILKLRQFGYHWTRKRTRPIQIPYERFCLVSLIFVGVENNRAIMGAPICSLAIKGCGIVGCKEHFEKFFIGDLNGIELNFYDLCMSSFLTAHLSICRVFYVSPPRTLTQPTPHL